MKISKRDAELLLILAGLLVFLILYLGVYNHFQTEADSVESDIAALQPQLTKLENENAHLAEYEQGITEYRTSVKDKLAAFPADIKDEDFLSYLLTMSSKVGISMESVTFDAPTLLSEFDGILEQNGTDTNATLDACRIGTVMTGQLTYKQLKSAVDYIYSSATQTSLDSVSVSFDAETSKLTGSFAVSRYYVQWPGAVYSPETLPTTSLGVSDLFGTT